MPDERFIHPGEGESDKLTQLTDFEHRVWIAYKLAANDVGVMLDSPAPVQTINRNLRNRPAKDVRKALDAMLRLELLIRFKHGGEHYLCSPLWQDWQSVKYPRETHLPLPDDGSRGRCSDVTQKLFELLESKRKAKRERLLKDSEPLGNISKTSESLSEESVLARESSLHAHAGNANAIANRRTSGFGPLRRHPLEEMPDAMVEGEFCDRANDFMALFGRLHLELRGARYVGKSERDQPEALRLVNAYADVELDAITRLYLVATGGRYDNEPRSPGRLRDAAGEMEKRLKDSGKWPTAA
jgi:hypothetical protein